MTPETKWDHYCHFYRDTLDEPARTRREVAFLEAALAMDRPMDVLDLACGHGRHAVALAQAGHRVTGVDAHDGFLRLGREVAARSSVEVRFFHEDMRRIDFHEEFDRAVLLFTSFGYFGDDDNRRVLETLFRALRPGGMLCLDTLNRDVLLKNLRSVDVLEKGSDLLIDRSEFDTERGIVHARWTFIRDGIRSEGEFPLRVYNPTELRLLLESVGFTVCRFYGDLDPAVPLSGEARRLVVVAQRQDGTR